MWIAFHKDSVDIDELCEDLHEHGAVYWHTTRPNFANVTHQVEAQGVEVLAWCARPNGEFMNFLVRAGVPGQGLEMLDGVAAAIIRWQDLGEPVPHAEPVRRVQDGGARR